MTDPTTSRNVGAATPNAGQASMAEVYICGRHEVSACPTCADDLMAAEARIKELEYILEVNGLEA